MSAEDARGCGSLSDSEQVKFRLQVGTSVPPPGPPLVHPFSSPIIFLSRILLVCVNSLVCCTLYNAQCLSFPCLSSLPTYSTLLSLCTPGLSCPCSLVSVVSFGFGWVPKDSTSRLRRSFVYPRPPVYCKPPPDVRCPSGPRCTVCVCLCADVNLRTCYTCLQQTWVAKKGST